MPSENTTQQRLSRLESLSTELLWMIVASCHELRDIAALALASHRCNDVTGLKLYQSGVDRGINIAYWAAKNDSLGTLKRLAIFCRPDVLGSQVNGFSTMNIGRNMPSVVPRQLRQPAIPSRPPRRRTPLYEAVSRGNLEIVKFLVDHGADVNTRRGFWNALRTFDFGQHPDVSDCTGFRFLDSPLLESIYQKRSAIAKVLLDHGASIQLNGSPGFHRTIPVHINAFHVAITTGSMELIDTFLGGNSAEVDQPDGKGYPPLLYALTSPHPRLAIEALKKWGANFDYILPDDGTAPGLSDRRLVPYLIQTRKWKEAAMLLEMGASLDMHDGQSRLLECCREVKEAAGSSGFDQQTLNEWNELVGMRLLEC